MGAAQALGTGAEQRIGVYFETEAEAEATDFALRARLLNHTSPVTAHVITYCVD